MRYSSALVSTCLCWIRRLRVFRSVFIAQLHLKLSDVFTLVANVVENLYYSSQTIFMGYHQHFFTLLDLRYDLVVPVWDHSIYCLFQTLSLGICTSPTGSSIRGMFLYFLSFPGWRSSISSKLGGGKSKLLLHFWTTSLPCFSTVSTLLKPCNAP